MRLRIKCFQLFLITTHAVFLVSCKETTSSNANQTDSSKEGAVTIESTPLVISYGGKMYMTTKIANQNWFANNLNYKGYGNDTVGVCYNNSLDSCSKYGRLYSWAEALELPDSCNYTSCKSQINPKQKGICPNGWHIPSDSDLTEMQRSVFRGENYSEGRELKSRSGWPIGPGTDRFGFSILPAGAFYQGIDWQEGRYEHVGVNAYLWSATESIKSGELVARYAWSRGFSSGTLMSRDSFYTKQSKLSIRCIED